MRSICPSEVFPTMPLNRFQCSLSRPLKEDRPALRLEFLCLSPPVGRWCDVLGFGPGCGSRFSTLQLFRDVFVLELQVEVPTCRM